MSTNAPEISISSTPTDPPMDIDSICRIAMAERMYKLQTYLEPYAHSPILKIDRQTMIQKINPLTEEKKHVVFSNYYTRRGTQKLTKKRLFQNNTKDGEEEDRKLTTHQLKRLFVQKLREMRRNVSRSEIDVSLLKRKLRVKSKSVDIMQPTNIEEEIDWNIFTHDLLDEQELEGLFLLVKNRSKSCKCSACNRKTKL